MSNYNLYFKNLPALVTDLVMKIEFICAEDLYDFVITNKGNIKIMEDWINIEGYSGVYKVSNLGRVRSYSSRYKGKILKPTMGRAGYLRLDLYDSKAEGKSSKSDEGKFLKNNRKTFYLHVLVAKYFCHNPDPENFNEVDHIDRLYDHCPFWNLRWTDREGNMDNRHFRGSKEDEAIADEVF